MKNILGTLLFCGFAATSFGQSERSDFTSTGRGGVATTFSTDYHALGINPANLGWAPTFEGRRVTFGFAETGISIFSEALKKPELWNSLLNWNDETFTSEQKRDAAAQFISKNVSVDGDFMLFGFAFQHEKIGGFAFQIRDRVNWYSTFNQNASEILFMGFNAPYFDRKYNEAGVMMSQASASAYPDSVASAAASAPGLFSEVLDGTVVRMNWYREFNLGYGRQIVNGDKLKVYAGVGAKYLQGIAVADLVMEPGNYTAFSAISPGFGINYSDSVMALNPSSVTQSGGIPNSVGKGFGFDGGVTIEIMEKLKIGVAVTDFGSITWSGNVYEADDNMLDSIASGGFDSYNIFLESEGILSDSRFFKWHGASSRTTELPATARLGASYRFGEKIEAGVDAILPLKDVAGSLTSAAVNFGIDVKPVSFLTLQTGLSTGGNYNANVPLGVLFQIGEGSWEAGAATRDILVFLTQDKPTLSASVGVLRFRF